LVLIAATIRLNWGRYVQMNKPEKRGIWLAVLHIFALCSFAVAQPLYDLLGRSAEFFVAHRASPGAILMFVLTVSIGVPAVLGLLEVGASQLSRRAQQAIHLFIVFGLAACIAAPLINRIPGLRAYGAVAATLAIAGVYAAAYARIAAIRSMMTVSALGVVAFPAIFLLMTPVSGLTFPSNRSTTPTRAAAVPLPPENQVPIVFIIFDEFEAGALLDEKEDIDSVRFPNFAALARDGLWYPRATSVWTETQRAVPAIMTGLRPVDLKTLPTVQSHPNNLFTWLGSLGYRLNVTEPLTSLCPRDYCAPTSPNADTFKPKEFYSDLSVIYWHVLLPNDVASKLLPAMDASWKGFGTAKGATQHGHENEKNFRDEFNEMVSSDRRPIIDSFIKGISTDRNVLNFLHVLLPHDPYNYLPSGSMYPGGRVDGMNGKVWTTETFLPTFAYQRYLLQVGFADRELGRLVAQLRSQGVYDSALIVVTADHGKSFRPGFAKRSISPDATESAPDLLQVPLFLKLPGLAKGAKSDRRVLTVDILPTIADVLGTELPWKSDGTSMIAESFPDRPTLQVPVIHEPARTMTFDVEALASYPRLRWKVETFGSRTPLDRIAIADPHSHLLGKSIAELPIRESASPLRIESDQLSLFDNVKLHEGAVPSLMTGRVKAPGPVTGMVRLAIALNGIVQVTTHTTEWEGSPLYFTAMLPEPAFRDGRNSVEFFAIEEQNGHVVLESILVPVQEQVNLIRDSSEGEHLRSTSGATYRIRRQRKVAGHIDRIDLQASSYNFVGWAIDPERLTPASRIVLLVNGKQVYSGKPTNTRLDLPKVFGTQNVADSGFSFQIPQDSLPSGASPRLFALSESGGASELPLGRAAQDTLSRPKSSQ
jgi:hypothetical protein